MTALLIYVAAVYGIAWIVAQSSILEWPRRKVEDVPVLGDLVACTVCTSFWVALALVLAPPLLGCEASLGIAPQSLYDVVLLVGCGVGVTAAVTDLAGRHE